MLKFAILLLSVLALTQAHRYFDQGNNIVLTPQGYASGNPTVYYDQPQQQQGIQSRFGQNDQYDQQYEPQYQFQQQPNPQYQFQQNPNSQYQFRQQPNPQYQFQQQPNPQYRIQQEYQPGFQTQQQYYPQQRRAPPQPSRKAIVKIQGEQIYGNITFTQERVDGPVVIEGTLVGLDQGEKGFHVHEKGDITGGCLSAGSHFNPQKATHGAPEDHVRHVGDLGNIIFDADKVARIHRVDNIISLTGVNSIVGRALVVHTGVDDLGRTSHPDSKTTGNAGGRAGCGVIGILEEPPSNSASLVSPTILTGVFVLLRYFIL